MKPWVPSLCLAYLKKKNKYISQNHEVPLILWQTGWDGQVKAFRKTIGFGRDGIIVYQYTSHSSNINKIFK